MAQVIAATASYLLTFIATQNARAANCNFHLHSKDIVAGRKTVGEGFISGLNTYKNICNRLWRVPTAVSET